MEGRGAGQWEEEEDWCLEVCENNNHKDRRYKMHKI